MENNYYVYQHVRLDTEAVFYVGKGRDKRAYTKSGRSQYWQNIVGKAGHRVEIVHAQLTEQESLDLEVETIAKYRAQGYTLCNMTDGGEGSSGYVTSAETIANKINASHKKAVVNNFGETYEGTRVAERATGVNATTISECCNGNRKSAGTRGDEKIVWVFVDDKDTLAQRVIEANNQPLKPLARQVLNNFGEVYASVSDAARATGVDSSSISTCCLGKSKSAGSRNGEKIVWVFKEDEDTLKQRVLNADNVESKPRKVTNNFGDVYVNIANAARETGVCNSSISACCLGKVKSAGKRDGVKIVWVYKEDEATLDQRVAETKNNNPSGRPARHVINNFGDFYDSVNAAARAMGVPSVCITACCNSEANYAGEKDGIKIVWVYKENESTLGQRVIKASNSIDGKPKQVTNNFGDTYASARSAAKATGVNYSSISECCIGRVKSAGRKDGVKIVWSFA